MMTTKAAKRTTYELLLNADSNAIERHHYESGIEVSNMTASLLLSEYQLVDINQCSYD